jgi:hypothetical protein
VTALRFLFIVTLRKPQVVSRLPFIREPRKLPIVLSPEEVARLLDAAPGLNYKAALSVAYGVVRASRPRLRRPRTLPDPGSSMAATDVRDRQNHRRHNRTAPRSNPRANS